MAYGYESDPGWQYLRLDPLKAPMPSWFKNYDTKKSCWVPDPEDGYIAAEIKSVKGDMATVATCKGTEMTLKKEQCQEMNPAKFERCEDMSNLSFLNDASVLGNLRSRYSSMLIYTYSGLFCVVINPYKRLPIYTESICSIFMGKRKTEMPPHLWAAADEAYRNMQQDRENQSMLITGESGAGKTENTKKVLAYFAMLGASQSAKPDPGTKVVTLEEQIVQTNPVLESFGNAKTVRNNNSSRFGKFIRVHFDKKGKMAGGDIEHYLLEKSRAIKQNPGERCYHIFYQLFSGFIPDLKKRLMLDRDVKEYHFVAQAEVVIAGMDDAEEHKATDEAFDILNFSQQEKDDIYKICSGLMHMGEIKFKQRGEQAEPEEDKAEAEKCAAMFGLNTEEYLKAITKPRVKVGTEWVAKGQTAEQVLWGVGAMCKGVYNRLFNFLVDKCNATLASNKAISKDYFIGVLDIAGFEIFDHNSFEQLWINFVNEKLQQFFNHHMFVLEQEEYQREGIHWEFIDFGLDLAATIELIEKPMGIISMLDEECIVPKATDLTYAGKLIDQHVGKHPSMEKPKPPKGKQSEAHFALRHYAGTVRYNVTAWLEKNKDPLNDTCVACMKNSKDNALIVRIWGDYQTQEEAAAAQKADPTGGGKKKGKSGAFMTVSMLYRGGLNNLMSMLHQTHPHFVRCIIPNELKKSGYIDAALVLNQLTCNGVLEGIRICRKGFPNRMMHQDFKFRYSIVAADEAKSSDDPKVCADRIMAKLVKDGELVEDNFRVGHTKVFFKAGILAHLEDCRDRKLNGIIQGLQAWIRSYNEKIAVKARRAQMAGLLILQRNIRSWLELRTWVWFKLYGSLQAMLEASKEAEKIEKMNDIIKELEEKCKKEESLRAELEAQTKKIDDERNELFMQLQAERDTMSDVYDRSDRLNAAKSDLEKSIAELSRNLVVQEEKNAGLAKQKKETERELDALKKSVQDLEMNMRKSQSETQAREHQIKSLQAEMAQQDELIAKLNKEKKNQEEAARKVTEDLQSQEDKVNHMNKVKAKLEQSLDELEDSLEREKRTRQDVEKAKRKVEGEVKVAQENIDELNKQKHDVENNLRRKEQELSALNNRLEDEQSLVAKLQKQIKELQAKIEELEEELNGERQSRSKAEKGKADLQRELEELSERLEEAGGSTAAQIEINKKREAELAKLRRDLDESSLQHESNLNVLRKKHNDAVAEMGDQLDQLSKQKAKLEKDKAIIQREIEDMHNSVDGAGKAKQNADKQAKALENALLELQAKVDEQTTQLADCAVVRGRLTNENSDLNRQLEDLDGQIGNFSRLKQQLQAQVEDAKRAADDETRERQSLVAQMRSFEHEADTLRTQLDEEAESKAESLRQVSKANAEVQQWRAKFESEGMQKAAELEEAKRKLAGRIQELTDQLEQANTKIASLDKQRHRLLGELDDAQVEVERSNATATQLEKKQKGFDKVVDDWKNKCSDLHAELDASQRENRNLSTDVLKLKALHDEISEQMEAVRRENSHLGQEIKDLSDQLGEGGRSQHELQKIVRRLEVEKEELQVALDEAESALEAEEGKVVRAQIEVTQIRNEIGKRIQEKEEEFDNTRKNHQRALDSMQASLEAEAKGRAELLRVKKQLESDINELEIALDHANRANADAQKNIKRCLEQMKELQTQVEEEQRSRDESRDQLLTSEKRCVALNNEKEDLLHTLESAERARKQCELEASDTREQLNDQNGQNQVLSGLKRKLEGEINALHADLEESSAELKAQEEQGKKAMMDAARLADELRQEQEHSGHIEHLRKGLEAQLKEMQTRLEEAEQAALKGGKKIIAKLEQKVRELETELEAEQRRHADSQKNLGKQDRRIRELQFQQEEDKKNYERLTDLVDKLQQKIKTYKRQVEEAEELASVNLNKYRQMQLQLDDAAERADVAENSLSKLRAKNRSSTSAAPGLLTSKSAAVIRSPSRIRSEF